jgi:hypothetical protein
MDSVASLGTLTASHLYSSNMIGFLLIQPSATQLFMQLIDKDCYTHGHSPAGAMPQQLILPQAPVIFAPAGKEALALTAHTHMCAAEPGNRMLFSALYSPLNIST